ncbi:hypothetical protein PISMIDRAFT_529915 [Pisolithus microcarpus 441]|uniref:Uncharacterized protein n=1 Tax=Pisolithus microcarpus 441 TaxID=765257 RepID=A0A0C9ZQQ8_9AGAM|nr:hypothetical protein PISMIDRAFT_529915 [Pisolithus microcarpus 441]
MRKNVAPYVGCVDVTQDTTGRFYRQPTKSPRFFKTMVYRFLARLRPKTFIPITTEE